MSGRSTEKHVLMVRHNLGKGTATYPVSVHVNANTATTHKVRLANAVKSGDVDAVKALAPTFKFEADGSVPANVKYQTIVLPYDPPVTVGADDTESFDF